MDIRSNAASISGSAVSGEVTAALHRRVVAWLVDLSIVLAVTAIVARTQAERFGPTLSLTEGQRARMAEVVSGPSISWIVGGETRVWAGSGLVTTLAAIGLTILIVFVLLPANVGGWTPGMRLAGLKVITTAGHRASLQHHLTRSAVGIVDLVPFVVPGLLGFVIAWRSPEQQRLGDRVAGTKVVDRSYPIRPVDPGTTRSRWDRFASETSTEGPASTDTPEVAAKNWAVVDSDRDRLPAVANTVARTVKKGRRKEPKPVTKVQPPLRREHRPHQASTAGPKSILEPGHDIDDAPAEPLPEQGQETAAEHDGYLIVSASDTATTDTATAASEAAASEAAASEAAASEAAASDTAGVAASDTAGVAASDTAIGGAVLSDATTAEAETSQVDERTPEGERGDSAEEAEQPPAVWSEELEAWTYLDTLSGRWYMHDPRSNRWIPIE